MGSEGCIESDLSTVLHCCHFYVVLLLLSALDSCGSVHLILRVQFLGTTLGLFCRIYFFIPMMAILRLKIPKRHWTT